jgi:methylenetetrahydrofolate dehydrogenase (NADP+)/methenyltetrahydrofolate cyclohydrolase
MSEATRIDGKTFAASLRADIGRKVTALKESHGLTPGLSVVLVGEDPASEVYVRNKGKATLEAGMKSDTFNMPADSSHDAVMAKVKELNQDPSVHGILVQLPLPDQVDTDAIINAINPDKDVDGFHTLNVGRLNSGQDAMVPCTPVGCMIMLKEVIGDLSGKQAIVVGRSNIVGKPMAALLLKENCTVTIAHSRTKDLAAECRRADIVIAAVGRAKMVKGDWIKPGAVVIDVGINRIDDASTKSGTRLVGDVDYDEAAQVASAITPVPGGVGPMTIACLLKNTVTAACRQAGVAEPK